MKTLEKMNETEMKTVCGRGHIELDMDASYRVKSNCMNKAAKLIDQHLISGMTQKQLQEEIFAHAAAYYRGDDVRAIPGVGDAIADWLVSKGEKIFLEDNGDAWYRQVAYTAIWNFFGDNC